MLSFEDFKILSANMVCMILLAADSINTNLQSILFLATIIYTFVRIVNEIKKFRYKKYGESDTKSENTEDNQ